MQKVKTELTPRDVSMIIKDMPNNEKAIFFECYEFSQATKSYWLVNKELLKKCRCELITK